MTVPEILEEDALDGQVCFGIMDNLFVDQKVSPTDKGALREATHTISKIFFVNTSFDTSHHT